MAYHSRGRVTHQGGVRYRSQLEARVARSLEGSDFTYETTVLPYQLEHSYVPDFVIWRKKKGPIVIEVKGWFNVTDRRKMLAVKKHNPDADIRMVFGNADRQIGKGRRSLTYAEWCDKHGFPWAEGEVPRRWLK